MNNCIDCRFFCNSKGECRRYPPPWECVDGALWWCGEFKRRIKIFNYDEFKFTENSIGGIISIILEGEKFGDLKPKDIIRFEDNHKCIDFKIIDIGEFGTTSVLSVEKISEG